MDFLKYIDEHKDEMIKDLADLIAIDSVEDKPSMDAPFGKGPRDALLKFLEIGKRDGFEVDNVNNYAGDITFGDGEEIVGVLAHVDVVPAGGDWDTNPFELVNDGEFLQGRGTQDDKGPAIAAYYAMKALKDLNIPLKRKIRLILGTNEESGWGGINYYKQHKKMPDFGFTPDAEFPAIFAEKGITIGTLFIPMNFEKSCVKAIKGGNAANMVPDYCYIVVDRDVLSKEKMDLLKNRNLEIEEDSRGILIRAKGKSAHGSTPEKGVNAISVLFENIEDIIPEYDVFYNFMKTYNSKFSHFVHGEGLGIDFKDDVSGLLNFNIGMINTVTFGIEFVLNMRYPLMDCSSEKIKLQLETALSDFNAEFKIISDTKPLYIDPKSQLITVMMDAYREYTNDYDAEAMVIGGGTYAKAMDNCVAFGAMFLDDDDRMHQKNERIRIDRLIDAAKIYLLALYKLATQDKII